MGLPRSGGAKAEAMCTIASVLVAAGPVTPLALAQRADAHAL
jgi:hypothetical protein